MSTWNKQRDCYGYDFWRGGERHRGYCLEADGTPAKTKTRANEIERALKAEVEARLRAAPKAAPEIDRTGFTLMMALDEYLTRAEEENRSAFNNSDYANELIGYFGADRLLADISEIDISGYRLWCSKQTIKVYTGGPTKGGAFKDSGKPRSPGTVNKYLIALEAAWKAAYRRHLPKIPGFPPCPEFKLLPTKKHLPNPVAVADVAKIFEVAPFHLVQTALLAVHTSMRLEEILGLEWSEVRFDFSAILLGPRTKNSEGRVVQLTATALQLLKWLHENRPAGSSRVVLYWPKGYGEGVPKPISSIARSWRTAQVSAGIEKHYKFHDLRGAMGTFLAGSVAPLPLQKWLGHKNLKTTMRYIEIADSLQRQAASLADGYGGTDGVVARAIAPRLVRPLASKEEARKFVGVYVSGKYGYQAAITMTTDVDGKKTKKLHYLGSFDSAEDAALAYDASAAPLGRKLNFPEAANEPVPLEPAVGARSAKA